MKKFIFTLAIAMMVFANDNLFAQSSDNMAEAKAFAQQRHHQGERSMYEPVTATYRGLGTYEEEEFRVSYSYDESDYSLREELTQVKVSNDWRNRKLVTYDYDLMGNVSTSLEQEWKNSSWTNKKKQTDTYNSDNKIDMTIVQKWENSVWVNDSKMNYIYAEDIVHAVDSVWNEGAWKARYYYTFTETSDSYEIQKQEIMDDGTLENVYIMTYHYDADHNLIEKICQEWSHNSFYHTREVYNYEGSLNVSVYFSECENGVWTEPYGKIEFVYDDNGNATGATVFMNIDGQWVEESEYVALYCEITMQYAYGTKSRVFSFSKSVIMDYADVSLSTNEMTENTVFNLYPNPANGVISVNGEGFEKAEIYNIAGQKVMESSNAQIDVEALQAGVYMVKVFGNGSSEMLRVVVK